VKTFRGSGSGLLALSLVVALSGCKGPEGPAGPAGADGTDGTDGTDGMDGMDGMDVAVDPTLTPVEKAFAGIGGQPAVEALTSYTYVADGTRWIPGEQFLPEDQLLEAATFTVTVNWDAAADGLRLDYDRLVTLFGLNVPLTSSDIIDGDVGTVTGSESFLGFPGADMVSDRWASDRKAQRLMNPVLILADIAADPTIATDAGVGLLDGSVHHLVAVADAVAPITLWVNAQNGHIDRLSTLENDWVHRDSALDVFFYGWQPSASGLLYPAEVFVAFGGEVVHEEARSSYAVNEAIDPTLFDLPAGAAPVFDATAAARGEANHEWHQNWSMAGLPLDGEQVYVAPTEIQPGVWWLAGGSHHSMIIEQANSLVLVEAPLDDARAEAIAGWAAATYPTKPIAYVISTHHHDDHNGGLRTFVALGATVICGEAALDFHTTHFRAPSTVYPDMLALAPVSATIVTVPAGGSMTLPDAVRPVEIYDVNNVHAAGMLMVYAPNEQVLFESDLYNPGLPPIPPWALGLHASIVNDWGLTVATIAGGHGTSTSTFAEFLTAIGM